MINMRRIVSLLFVEVALLAPLANAVTYDVSATSDGMGLTEALELAQPGDSIYLADGTYDEAVVSYRDGEVDNPITIEGSSSAIINGDYNSRCVLINHSFITLRGFSVEGQIGDGSDTSSYINKCVYVEGEDSELDGFVMEGLLVQNCGGECVRLKNNVTNAEILNSTIQNCGIHDYDFDSEDKNGEGIYIGTSSNQWVNNATDNCTGNVVRGNTISTYGNECVDIKEGSTQNLVEENTCSNQLDDESGCYDARGDNNTIRYNIATNCLGAGVRLGGWEVDGHAYGQGNNVYGNNISDCGVGSIKVETEGQGDVCGNTCEGDNCLPVGSESEAITGTWDKACSGNSSSSTSTETSDDFLSMSTEGVDDDGSTIIGENHDITSTVTESSHDNASTVTDNDYDDSSSVSEDDDDESTATETNDDDASTITEDDDDESTVTETSDDDASTITEVDDVGSTVTESSDDNTSIVTEEEDDSSTNTEDDGNSDNDDGDKNLRRRDRGSRV